MLISVGVLRQVIVYNDFQMEPLLVKATRVLRLPPWIPVRSTSADQGLHVPEFGL
ncbi:hypothetical protein Hanom_Chr04g00314591 [Helianthus anomalus]